MIDINVGDALKAINSGNTTCIRFHFPDEYVHEYLQFIDNIDIDEMNVQINAFLLKLYHLNNGRILDEKPQDVAAAAIVFYMQKYGFNIENKEAFYSNISKSSATINKILKMISMIVNN